MTAPPRGTPGQCPAHYRLTEAHPPAYRPLVLTAAYVGLRWGELVGLAVGNVDLLRRTIAVDRQLLEVNGRLSFGPPKTRAGIRIVSMPKGLAKVLGQHFGSPAVQASGLAFPGPKGAPLRSAGPTSVGSGARRRRQRTSKGSGSMNSATRRWPWPWPRERIR